MIYFMDYLGIFTVDSDTSMEYVAESKGTHRKGFHII